MNPNVKVIGITGKMGAGKDTAADIIVAKYGYLKVPMMFLVKEYIGKHMFQFSEEQMYTLTGKATPDNRWRKPGTSECYTPRDILDIIGKIFREQIHPEIFVQMMKHYITTHDQNIVIPDIRYRTEIDMVLNFHGRLIKMCRTNYEYNDEGRSSEHQLDNMPDSAYNLIIYADSGDINKIYDEILYNENNFRQTVWEMSSLDIVDVGVTKL